jgi:hypothetical protein
MLQGVYLVYHMYPTFLHKKQITKLYKWMQQWHKPQYLVHQFLVIQKQLKEHLREMIFSIINLNKNEVKIK